MLSSPGKVDSVLHIDAGQCSQSGLLIRMPPGFLQLALSGTANRNMAPRSAKHPLKILSLSSQGNGLCPLENLEDCVRLGLSGFYCNFTWKNELNGERK